MGDCSGTRPMPVAGSAAPEAARISTPIPLAGKRRSPEMSPASQARPGAARKAPSPPRRCNPPWSPHEPHRPRAEPLIREVPLSRLALASENVRKMPPDGQADAELKASITALGLQAEHGQDFPYGPAEPHPPGPGDEGAQGCRAGRTSPRCTTSCATPPTRPTRPAPTRSLQCPSSHQHLQTGRSAVTSHRP